MSDDQGFGDVACHGNPKIRTPNLDRLAREGTELSNFYVCPVCSPTRASLMTGRYNYRTGVVDTFLGRSLMYPDEVTLPQMLAAAGYRTGIFGKWHLGDNYPMRPQDRGFHEVLVLKGGGIGQPSDPPGGESYFDPILQHNGRQVKTKGYCSDVLTDAACRFIEAEQKRPFFVYLAFNAPHAPLEVPEADYQPYKQMNLSLSEFPKVGHPVEGRYDRETTARVYGMVTNLDRDVGRVLAKLDELKLADNTIFIFMTDNGPQQPRYKSGLRGRKGMVYDGGIHVPFFVRWQGVVPASKKVDAVAAHIDLVPTLLEACRIDKPSAAKLDGTSLLPLWKGARTELPDRSLFFQWHRGDRPELFRSCAVRTPRWKMVQPVGLGSAPLPAKPRFELYEMKTDPFEQHDVAEQHPDVIERLRKQYEAWFHDVSAHGYPPSRIFLGTPHENPTVLTRQDWRGAQAGWDSGSLGHWEVRVADAGKYQIILHFANASGGKAHFSLGQVAVDQEVPEGALQARFRPVSLNRGDGALEAWLANGTQKLGVRYVEVTRVP
jgi:arylsulfatase A-like enzyme